MRATSAEGEHPEVLAGIRVLDMGRVLAAPLAAQMLADMGAEVIKVERPGSGDDGRAMGPPFLPGRDGSPTRETPMYLSVNRNKKSITLDFSRPSGQQIARELAKRCDVLIENYKVGDLERFGLGYAQLRALNPRLVYCSVTGFGHTGPYRKRAGYDGIFQAMGGLMSLTGQPDGVPGGGPVKVGASIVDILAGLYAANAILGALHWRARSGLGQHIDLALLDTVIASLSHQVMRYFITGAAPPRRGSESPGGVPGGMFECADGAVMIVTGNDSQYRRLCEVLGRPDLGSDARFQRNSGRVQHRQKLVAELARTIGEWPKDRLLAALEQAGIPAGAVNDLSQVFSDPQVVERGLELRSEHPLAGELKLLRNPIRYSKTPIERYAAPPLLGADTDTVLMELLGMQPGEIDALRREGTI